MATAVYAKMRGFPDQPALARASWRNDTALRVAGLTRSQWVRHSTSTMPRKASFSGSIAADEVRFRGKLMRLEECSMDGGVEMKLQPIGLALLIALVAPAYAQSGWKPQKNIEIIVGTSPGGGQDRSARAVQRLLESKRLLDVSSTVVNKPGAGSALGYAYLNQHPGDAHFIMLSTTPLLTNPITGLQKITYEDLTPLAMLFDEYIVASVAASSSIRDGKDLLARLKADPGSLTIGIPGVGGGGHLGFALAAKAAGVDPSRLKTVVFKSGGDSITALLGGHIDVMSSTTAAPVPQHRAGKVRIVAIGSRARLPGDLATVPTWRELGANVEFANWRGMVGPRDLTAEQIAYWEQVFAAVAETPEFRQDLERNHWSANFAKSAGMRKRLKAEHDELRALLTDLGMAK